MNMASEVADKLEALAVDATPGPWALTVQEENEPASPDIYGIHGSDTSYEATLAQLWSGEHENTINGALISELVNNLPLILQGLRSLQGAVPVAWEVAGEKLCEEARRACRVLAGNAGSIANVEALNLAIVEFRSAAKRDKS